MIIKILLCNIRYEVAFDAYLNKVILITQIDNHGTFVIRKSTTNDRDSLNTYTYVYIYLYKGQTKVNTYYNKKIPKNITI